MAAPGEEEEEAAAAAEAEESDGDEKALKRLEDLVTELYRFRDRLPQKERPAEADAHEADAHEADAHEADAHEADARPAATLLADEMEKTLRLMDEIEVSPQGRGRALVLRARALGVSPAGRGRAEEALSRAVKLAPGLGPAWLRLGEARWQRGDVEGARACFAGALAHGEDAEARRLLSMALRAGGAGGALRESLAQAEAAVRCAPTDGRSWYVLGNAYVSLFFAGGQSPDAARRALGAYAQAERVDPEAANNPDLHLNRATGIFERRSAWPMRPRPLPVLSANGTPRQLLQYQERFGAALEGLGRAAALAPGWEEPRRRHAHLLDFLGRLCALLANRGKLRGKRRRGLEGPLPPSLLGPLGRGLRPSPLAALQPGPNPQRVLLGRVLFTLTPPEGVPYAVGVADGAGSAAALTIYNAAPGWGVLVGDGLAVAEPRLCHHLHQWQGKTFSFAGIRVPSPLSLVVNGRRPPGPALAPARLALVNDPAPASEAPPP